MTKMHYTAYFCAGLAAMQLIAANPGYLPSIGPAPLRYQGADKSAVKFTLPPLDMGNLTNRMEQRVIGSSSAVNNQSRSAGSNEIAGLLSPPAINASNPNLIVANAQSGGAGDPMGLTSSPQDLSANPPITAQMLVHFFNANGATGQVSGVVLTTNIPFMPPTLVQPSSSATYSSPNAP